MKLWRPESGCRVASRGSSGNHTLAPKAPHHSHKALDNCVDDAEPLPHDQTLSTHDASTVAGRQL